MKEHLLTAISQVHKSYNKNELAYLALTSKIENQLRDRIAFLMHKKLKNHYRVCREWHRPNDRHQSDLAIVDRQNGSPITIIEFKAQAAPKYETKHLTALRNDLEKMKKVAESNTEMYFVHFNTIVSVNKISNKLSDSIKYFDAVCSLLKFSKEELRNNSRNAWKRYIAATHNGKVEQNEITIPAGKYYNIEVEIQTFILGPVTMKH